MRHDGTATSERADVVFACGGTGGHVYPALAVARALAGLRPEWKLRFLGREGGLEARVVPAGGFPFTGFRVGGLRGKGFGERLRGLLLLPGAVLRSFAFLHRARPRIVVGTGGYVSGPVLLAALLRGIPFLIQEQNRAFGATNRLLHRFAAVTAVSFEETAASARRTVVTGNPARPEFAAIPPLSPFSERGNGEFRILVFGGSQGSRRLNRAVVEALPLLAAERGKISLRHQTGPNEFEEVREGWRKAGLEAEADRCVTPYVERMAEAFAQADLVVCRAGASTVAELTASGRPSVLVPFPYATGDHQRENAMVLSEKGAAILVNDAEMTGVRLAEILRRFLKDPAELSAMAEKSRSLGRPDAALRIAELCVAIAEGAGARAGEGARA